MQFRRERGVWLRTRDPDILICYFILRLRIECLSVETSTLVYTQGEFKIIVVTKNGEKKLLGTFEFDVAEWANSGKENISVKKQFGDKIKAILEFEVFLKCIGEASETSKSVDRQIRAKK